MAAADLNTVRSVIEDRLATELAKAPPVPAVFQVLASPAPEGYFQTQVRVTFEFIEEL